MKLDNVRRIIVEDFQPDDQPVATKLAETLNSFMEQVVNTVNGNLDIDNLTRSTVEIKVKVDSTGVPIQLTKFAAKTGMRGCNVLNVENLTNTAKNITSSPFLKFTSQGNGIYTVKYILGLSANDEYKVYVELVP